MTGMNESLLLDDMDDATGALDTGRDDVKPRDGSQIRRSLEEYLEKKALRNRLRDTYDDAVDLSELGW